MKSAVLTSAIVQVIFLVSLSSMQCLSLNRHHKELRLTNFARDRGRLHSYTFQNIFNLVHRGFPRISRRENLAGQLRNIPSGTSIDSLKTLHRSRRQSDQFEKIDAGREDTVSTKPTAGSTDDEALTDATTNLNHLTTTDSYSPAPSDAPSSFYGPPSINAPAINHWTTAYPANHTTLRPSYGPPVGNYRPPLISVPATNPWITTYPPNYIAIYPGHGVSYEPTSGYGSPELWMVDNIYFTASKPNTAFVYSTSTDAKQSNLFKSPYLYLPGNDGTAQHSYFKPSRPDHFQNFWEFSRGYFVPIQSSDGVH